MPSHHTPNDDQNLNDGVEAAGRREDDDAITLNQYISPEHEREDIHKAGTVQHSETSDAETEGEWAVDVGVDVIGCCGHKIGEVVDVRDDYVVVEKGFFIPEDVYVPKSAISGADEHHLTLNVSKDSVNHSDWDEDPEEFPAHRHERAS